jgi:hypothetical protein
MNASHQGLFGAKTDYPQIYADENRIGSFYLRRSEIA